MNFHKIVSSTAIKEQRIKSQSKTWIQNQANKQAARTHGSRIGKFAAGVKGWLVLERVIALTLLFFPFLLIAVDGWPTGDKDSISAYYAMSDPKNLWAFYFPLTVAAFMFIANGVIKHKSVNGVIKHKSWYNIYLGVMLSGVILFNHVDFKIIHPIFAILFFVGNFIVVLVVKTGFFEKPIAELFFDVALIAIAILSVILFGFHVINLFYLEWISFAMITIHFFLSSYGTTPNVKPRKTGPSRVNS